MTGSSFRTVVVVRIVPWWGVVSAATAPVLLISGWTLAAGLHGAAYDQVSSSVSALAAEGAPDRWVMTSAFAVAAACEVLTGLALRPAALAGRVILVAGGLAGMLVAANPQPVRGGFSLEHAIWAGIGFGALCAWPAGAWLRGPQVPWALRSAVSASAVVLMTLLLVWFVAEVVAGGGQIGLAERALGGSQTAWPLVVVLSCRRDQPGPAGQPASRTG
ncbi:MAG TPA: DUF998 domain-containing protein [Streptosporangiaceae bacterium]